MFSKVKERLSAPRDEEGAALLSVVVLAFVLFVTIAAIAMSLQTGLRQTVTEKASMASRIAAESGTDAGLASALFGECVPEAEDDEFGFTHVTYGNDFSAYEPSAPDSFGNREGCPATGDLYLIVHATGTSESSVDTEITSVYQWGNGTEEEAFDETASEHKMPTLISRTER